MIPDIRDHAALNAAFRWRIPARYNIGTDVCDRWAAAEPDRPAILEARADGGLDVFTYGEMKRASDRLAAALAARGLRAGDRAAILLPQGRDVPVAHVALYKLGVIVVPLAALFGADAIAYRLADAGAKALITNASGLAKIAGTEAAAGLELIVSTDGADGAALDFHKLIADGAPVAARGQRAGRSRADDLHLGHHRQSEGRAARAPRRARPSAGVQLPHEFLPQPGDRLWTPADWAWAGGLLNILLPGLHFGVPVLAAPVTKFDPEWALDLMARHGVRNAFVPPTALRMLRTVESPLSRFPLKLRTIGSGGESLGAEVLAWGREALGLSINEFYGQTECNLVVASCAAIGVVKPGHIGKAAPGHEVAVIRSDGSACAPDEEGQIAVRRPDPVMFLGYWNRPEATQAKFIGDWMTTGDQGCMDAEGYIRFVGRDDDVITSSGYRIGPGEIEDCLIRHPAVALAAVVGKPDRCAPRSSRRSSS